MTTKDERIAQAASDMGFDDPSHMLEFLEGAGLSVTLKGTNKTAKQALDDLRRMFVGWHKGMGPHATHDSPAIESAIFALEEAARIPPEHAAEEGRCVKCWCDECQCAAPEATARVPLPDYELAVKLDAANARVAELEKLCASDRRAFIERAAISFATHPQYDQSINSHGGLDTRAYILTQTDAVKEAVALWDAVQKALTE